MAEQEYARPPIDERQKIAALHSRREVQTHNLNGRYDEAVSVATSSLRASQALYGTDHVATVEHVLDLAQSLTNAKKLASAEDMLTQANWILVKHPDSSVGLKSRLFRILGSLYEARGNSPQALKQFAEDVFHSSLGYGCSSAYTACGYCHQANVFDRCGYPDAAHALYRKVVEIWHEQLYTSITTDTAHHWDEFLLRDGRQQLEGIRLKFEELVQRGPVSSNPTTPTTPTLLAMLSLAMAEISFVQFNYEGSQAWLDKAAKQIDKLPDSSSLHQELDAIRDHLLEARSH